MTAAAMHHATWRPMSEQYEAMVRLVHQHGAQSVPDLLSLYRARAISAPSLRKTLDVLCDRGWLERQPDPRRPDNARALVYALTPQALPELQSGARLGLLPGMRRPGAVRAGGGALALPRDHAHMRATYVPPPPPPMRPGAQDFKAIASLGAFV